MTEEFSDGVDKKEVKQGRKEKNTTKISINSRARLTRDVKFQITVCDSLHLSKVDLSSQEKELALN